MDIIDRMIVIGGSEPAIWPDWIRLCTGIVRVCTREGASVRPCYEPGMPLDEDRSGSLADVSGDSAPSLTAMC